MDILQLLDNITHQLCKSNIDDNNFENKHAHENENKNVYLQSHNNSDCEEYHCYSEDDISQYFIHPIKYDTKCRMLPENIIHDLELIECNEKNDVNNIINDYNNIDECTKNLHIKKQKETKVLSEPKTENKTKTETETKDQTLSLTNETNKPIYNYIYRPANKLHTQYINDNIQYYTTNKKFLKDTQKICINTDIQNYIQIYKRYNINIEDFTNVLTSNMSSNNENYNDYTNDKYNDNNDNKFNEKSNKYISDIFDYLIEIKNETSFCEKYLFVDYKSLKFINNNILFLEILSIYNILSPLLTLLIPLFILILPFFIIKIQGHKLSFQQYIHILKILMSNNSILELFTNFNSSDIKNKIYLLVSCGLYVFNLYQNILICIRFYNNLQKICDYIFYFKNYIEFSLQIIDYYLENNNNYNTYLYFHNKILDNRKQLHDIYCEISKLNHFNNASTTSPISTSQITDTENYITPSSPSSPSKIFDFLWFKNIHKNIFELGNIMYIFYQFHNNEKYYECMMYSFGFHSYIYNIIQIKNLYKNNIIHKTKFSNKSTFVKNIYYPKFINNKDVVKNNCNLEKNIIITGPNASGKTTFLKTIFINIYLSQQIGFGCYDKLLLNPYDYFHSYLNIPDTSARDSLFQAEARRCKIILDFINKNKQKRHFCIFDELYSGTNPTEAILSASSFMNYISNKNNTTFLLTTHFYKICKKLQQNKNIVNFHMNAIKQNDKIIYLYKIKSGISKIKCGMQILKELNYPKEIYEHP